MELDECVRADRATRSFSDEPVDDETVERLIDAARRAGSGKNRQPWSFVVVRDPDRLDDLAAMGRYASPLRDAAVGIVLLVDVGEDGEPSRGDVFDGGRAFQNLKLAATAMGLGSVPQSIDAGRAGRLLSVPDGKRVLIALALGHPGGPDDTIEGEEKEAVLSSMGRRSLEELIHHGTHR